MKTKKNVSRSAQVLLLAASIGIALSQSKDRDHPTLVTSPDITGFIDQTVENDNYYYSFTAGPGELTITFDVESTRGGSTVAAAVFSLYDVKGQQVFNQLVQSSGPKMRAAAFSAASAGPS